MRPLNDITWPDSVSEARRVRRILGKRVNIAPLKKKPECIAGADASFFEDNVIAAVCVYSYPDLSLLERTDAVRKVTFPYIPGFLSFREGPAIIDAINKLKTSPDIILFDGQGIAHPAGLGIASHIGALLGIPTIGCAKSRLVGEFKEPRKRKGGRSALQYGGKTVGVVLRTRDNVRPLFISPGHGIDLEGALKISLHCMGRYRLLEPVRCADLFSKEIKRRYALKISKR